MKLQKFSAVLIAVTMILFFSIPTIILGQPECASYDECAGWAERSLPEAALAYWTRAIELAQEDLKAIAYNKRGFVNFLQGSQRHDERFLDQAITDQTTAISLKPDFAEAYKQRGDVYNRKGESESAFADFQKAVELDPTQYGAHLNMGNIFREREEYDKAEKSYLKARQISPETTDSYINLTSLFAEMGGKAFNAGDNDKADDYFTRAILENDKLRDIHPESMNEGLAYLHFNRGTTRVLLNRPEEGVEDFTKGIELLGEQAPPSAYLARGVARSRSNQCEQAIEDLSKAADVGGPVASDAIFLRGSIYHETGRTAEAYRDFNEAIQAHPMNVRAYTARGFARYEDGDLNGALADLNKATEMDQEKTCACTLLPRSAMNTTRADYAAAMKDLEEAIEIEGQEAYLYAHRATLSLAVDDFERAEKDAEKALELDQNDNTAYEILASLAILRGETEDARNFLSKIKPDVREIDCGMAKPDYSYLASQKILEDINAMGAMPKAGQLQSKGEKAWEAGDRQTAAVLLLAASSIEPKNSAIVRRAGDVFKMLDEKWMALEFYYRRLHIEPNAPDRAEVEQAIHEIQSAGQALFQRFELDAGEEPDTTETILSKLDVENDLDLQTFTEIAQFADSNKIPPAQLFLDAMEKGNERIRKAAITGLMHFGSNDDKTLPALMRALKDPSPRVRNSAVLALRQLVPSSKTAIPKLIESLDDKDVQVRESAVETLGMFGSDAATAIPKILEGLKKARFGDRLKWAEALGKIAGKKDKGFRFESCRSEDGRIVCLKGNDEDQPETGVEVEEIAEQLIDMLLDRETPKDAGFGLSHALAQLNSDSSRIVPKLVEGLKSAEANVQMNALKGLWQLGGKSAPALPALIDLLKIQNPDIRREAAGTIGRIGPAAKSAAPQLIAMLGGENQDVRADILWVLGRIEPPVEEVLPHLITGLSDPWLVAREWAASSIGQYGRDAAPAVPLLIVALQDSNMGVRMYAAESLHDIGLPAEEAVPALIQSLHKDDDSKVRSSSARALGAVGRNSELTGPALISALGDSDLQVVQNALDSLELLGLAWDDDIENALVEMLKAGDIRSKTQAVRILIGRGPKAKAAVPPLVKILETNLSAREIGKSGPAREKNAPDFKGSREDDRSSRRADEMLTYAILALRQMGAEAEPAIPALMNLLNEQGANVLGSNPSLSLEAKLTLLAIGPALKSHLTALTEFMSEPGNAGRFDVIEIIGELGPEAEAAVPLIEPFLEHENPQIRLNAAAALAKINPSNKKYVEILIAALDFKDLSSLPPMSVHPAQTAINLLAQVGPDATEAVPALIGIIKGTDPVLKQNAIAALGKIGPAAAEAADLIAREMESGEDFVRLWCATALLQMGQKKQEAAIALNEAFYNLDRSLKYMAIQNMLEEHVADQIFLGPLIEDLGANDVFQRTEAAEFLGHFGKLATEAVPALKKNLEDKDGWVREETAKALRNIQTSRY